MTAPSIHDVYAQRHRWHSYRQGLRLVDVNDDGFGLGGIGGWTEGLDLRLVFLPTDPLADIVRLDAEGLEWLKADRTSPFGGSPVRWGSYSRASSSALIAHDRRGSNLDWSRYLALHRHGGLEIGAAGLSGEVHGIRVFWLQHIVGLAYSALAIQKEVTDRWDASPPYELTVALRNTQGAVLSGFAEGWANVGQGLSEPSSCLETNVLLRWELPEDLDVDTVAIDIGNRIEQAFGTTLRRHLARQGEYEGRFDPRFAS